MFNDAGGIIGPQGRIVAEQTPLRSSTANG
jgi:hypothetical protein